jgi:hypothetical protein
MNKSIKIKNIRKNKYREEEDTFKYDSDSDEGHPKKHRTAPNKNTNKVDEEGRNCLFYNSYKDWHHLLIKKGIRVNQIDC